MGETTQWAGRDKTAAGTASGAARRSPAWSPVRIPFPERGFRVSGPLRDTPQVTGSGATPDRPWPQLFPNCRRTGQ